MQSTSCALSLNNYAVSVDNRSTSILCSLRHKYFDLFFIWSQKIVEKFTLCYSLSRSSLKGYQDWDFLFIFSLEKTQFFPIAYYSEYLDLLFLFIWFFNLYAHHFVFSLLVVVYIAADPFAFLFIFCFIQSRDA